MIRKKLQRKAAGVLLAVVMMCCMQPNLAHAEANLEHAGEIQMQVESISPMYVQGNKCQVRLDFSGTTANCQVVIKGKSGTTKISGLLKLYDNTAGRQVKGLSGAVTYQDVKDIIRRVLEEKELDREAENYGCQKSREDTEKYINELREEIKLTDNYDEYLAFVAGTGMSEDDYWQSKVESYRKQLIRKEYMERKYQEFISEEEGIVLEEDMMSELEEVQIEDMQDRIDFMQDLREDMVKESDIDIIGDLSVYTQ